MAAEARDAHSHAASYVLLSFIMIIGALDFGVVIPSLWQYLQTFDADEVFYGYVIASFMCCRMLLQPLLSGLTDTMGFKRIYVASLLIQLFGELIYAFASSKWMVLVGRMVCGCGSATGDLGYAYMGRSLKSEEVSAFQLRLTASRSIGTILGPAASLFAGGLDVTLPGGVRIWKLNSPALVIAAMDVVALVGMFGVFKDLGAVAAPIVKNVSAEGEESGTYRPLPADPADNVENTNSQIKELFRPGLFVVNMMVGITATNLALIEVVMSPISQDYFDWSLACTSASFALLAMMVMMLNFSIAKLGGTIPDRTLIGVGAAISITGASAIMLWWREGSFTQIRFILSLVVFSIAQPSFMIGALRALYTKLTPPHMQGALQGWCSFMYSAGNLVGAQVGGFALKEGLLAVRVVMFGTCATNVVLFIAGWRHMLPIAQSVRR